MVELESYALFVRLLPCVFLLWLAWVVGRSAFPQGSSRWLGAFFTVVALGFFLQFLYRLFEPLGGAAQGLVAFENVLGAIDPPILLAFSLAVLQSRWLRAPWVWIAYLVAGPASFFLSYAGAADAYPALKFWGPIAYVNVTYLVSFGLLLRAYLREPYKFRARQLFFVVVAVGFAAFSRSGALFFGGLRSADPGRAFVLPSFLVEIGLLVAFWATTRFLVPTAVRRSNAVYAWLFALLAAFAVAYYLVVLWDDLLGFHASLRVQYFGLRWLVVGGILGYGVVRHQLFDFGLRTRQAAAFLSAVAVGLAAAFIAATRAQAGGTPITGARAIGFAAGFAASLLTYHLVAWLWRRSRRGADLPASYRHRRLELYEAALEFSLAHRDWTLAERLFADTLRDVFEITPEEHERVLKSLQGALPETGAGDGAGPRR